MCSVQLIRKEATRRRMPEPRATGYAEFLSRLRQARLSAGLSQTAVARLLRKPQSFVSKCESGDHRVDVVELRLFARVYRQPMNYFIHD